MRPLEDLRGESFVCTILVSTRGGVKGNRIGSTFGARLQSARCEVVAQHAAENKCAGLASEGNALSDGRFWLLLPLLAKVTPPFVCSKNDCRTHGVSRE